MANVSRSFRFPALAWERLCRDAQAAGQDRTAYLTRLIEARTGNGELARLQAENAALKAMLGAPPDAVVLSYAPPEAREVLPDLVPQRPSTAEAYHNEVVPQRPSTDRDSTP